MHIVIQMPIGQGSSVILDVNPELHVHRLFKHLSNHLNISEEGMCLVFRGEVLSRNKRFGDLGLSGNEAFILMPAKVQAAVDKQMLFEEYNYLRTQFPLVKMVDLMTYTGKLRCERGPVKELADKGIWPFTEYVKWHEFKMTLSFTHPFKPPTVTWLTDINHPNIIPHKKGKVCVSIIGKKWLPNTKLAAVINALYFLLYDPNPYSAYPTKRCQEVAKICRMFGFPKRRRLAPG
jgi:hypothetical protein